MFTTHIGVRKAAGLCNGTGAPTGKQETDLCAGGPVPSSPAQALGLFAGEAVGQKPSLGNIGLALCQPCSSLDKGILGHLNIHSSGQEDQSLPACPLAAGKGVSGARQSSSLQCCPHTFLHIPGVSSFLQIPVICPFL